MKKINKSLAVFSIAVLLCLSGFSNINVPSGSQGQTLSSVLGKLVIPDEIVDNIGQNDNSRSVAKAAAPEPVYVQYPTSSFATDSRGAILLHMLKYDLADYPLPQSLDNLDIEVDWELFKNGSEYHEKTIEFIEKSQGEGFYDRLFKNWPIGKVRIKKDEQNRVIVMQKNNTSESTIIFFHYAVLTPNNYNSYDIDMYGVEKISDTLCTDFYYEHTEFESEKNFTMTRAFVNYVNNPTVVGSSKNLDEFITWAGSNQINIKYKLYSAMKNNVLQSISEPIINSVPGNGQRYESKRITYVDYNNKEYIYKSDWSLMGQNPDTKNNFDYGRIVDGRGRLVKKIDTGNNNLYDCNYLMDKNGKPVLQDSVSYSGNPTRSSFAKVTDSSPWHYYGTDIDLKDYFDMCYSEYLINRGKNFVKTFYVKGLEARNYEYYNLQVQNDFAIHESEYEGYLNSVTDDDSSIKQGFDSVSMPSDFIQSLSALDSFNPYSN